MSYTRSMCGRFNNHLPKMLGWAEMLNNWPDVPLRYNVAPTSTIAAFSLYECDRPEGHAMRWGMVPSWSKSFDSKYATFNARLESVSEKATFRSAWKQQQRCLIPMAGYFEWQAAGAEWQAAGAEQVATSGAKQPFYITDRNVGGLVAAGLYETWGSSPESEQGFEKQPAFSCTMITRCADSGLDKIHGRMPVLLTPETAGEWLACAADQAQQLLETVASPDLVFWPVSRAVGNVRNDDKRLCAPLDI